MFTRWAESKWRRDFTKPFVQIVFGARQTGKSTLIRSLLPEGATIVDLSNPKERGLHLSEPERLITLCRSLPAKETWKHSGRALDLAIQRVLRVPPHPKPGVVGTKSSG